MVCICIENIEKSMYIQTIVIQWLYQQVESQLVFFYQARYSSLVPAGFLTVPTETVEEGRWKPYS